METETTNDATFYEFSNDPDFRPSQIDAMNQFGAATEGDAFEI
jgi:hypothetical protein